MLKCPPNVKNIQVKALYMNTFQLLIESYWLEFFLTDVGLGSLYIDTFYLLIEFYWSELVFTDLGLNSCIWIF